MVFLDLSQIINYGIVKHRSLTTEDGRLYRRMIFFDKIDGAPSRNVTSAFSRERGNMRIRFPRQAAYPANPWSSLQETAASIKPETGFFP
jgi:hypothetical protein